MSRQLFCLLMLVLAASVLRADTIMLKDGTEVEGTVTADNSATVTVQLPSGALRTYRKQDIDVIMRSKAAPAKPAAPAPAAAPSAVPPPSQAKSAAPEVPLLEIRGTPGAEKLDFAKEKRAHATKLTLRGPSPQEFEKVELAGFKELTYSSGDLRLKAYYRAPAGASGQKRVPAVMYCHGGFAFGTGDLEVTRPFLDAGFAVFCPTLRGENGNPGNYEMFFGEADDALAAAKLLATQPEVNPARIYAFGHSAGGVIAGLLSLYRDAPLRFTGSSGGMYGPDIFKDLAPDKMTPFDYRDAGECDVRLLSRNSQYMVRPHVALIGKRDPPVLRGARDVQAIAQQNQAPILFAVVEGDHGSALQPSINLFLEILKKDLARP